MLLESLSPSFDLLTESKLALALRVSGTALATEEVPFSLWSISLSSDSSGSSCCDHSPAIMRGNKLITVSGAAEIEEKRSMDSSYLFCSNSAIAFKYLTLRNLIS